MEGQEYLNQISAENRPEKAPKFGFLKSKFFIVGAGGVIGLIIIIIIGSIIGSSKNSVKELGYALDLHITNTSKLIQTYQPSVKSSELRSSSASLYSVLSNTERDLSEYLNNKYGLSENKIPAKIVDQANLERDGLEADLFEAKINGILDRIFAHKMSYEITVFMTEEAKIIKSTNDEALVNILNSSYQSLENLYENFSNYSETK